NAVVHIFLRPPAGEGVFGFARDIAIVDGAPGEGLSGGGIDRPDLVRGHKIAQLVAAARIIRRAAEVDRGIVRHGALVMGLLGGEPYRGGYLADGQLESELAVITVGFVADVEPAVIVVLLQADDACGDPIVAPVVIAGG